MVHQEESPSKKRSMDELSKQIPLNEGKGQKKKFKPGIGKIEIG